MRAPPRPPIVLTCLLLALGACKDDGDGSTPAPADGEAKAPDAPSDAPAGAAKAPGSDPAAPVEPPEPPPSGHAVVKSGALLFTSSKGEVGFELPPVVEGVPGVTVNVVGKQDDRLIVETLVDQPPEHHCAATIDGLSDFRLRLFIAESDLLPVTTDEVVTDFGDGTKVRLTRGVPVPEGSTTIMARRTTVEITVPPDKLGRYYEPAEALSSEGSVGTIPEREGQVLTYGGRTLVETGLYRAGAGLSYFAETAQTGEHAGSSLVTVRSPCVEVQALVSDERLHPPAAREGLYALEGHREGGVIGELEAGGHFLASPYGGAFAVGGDDEDVWGGLTGTEVGEAFGVGGLGLVGTGRAEPTYQVETGTTILWSDGTTAGQVSSDHTFRDAPRDDGGRSCFDVRLSKEHAPTVALCFAPGDVTKQEPPSIGAIGGVVGGLGASGTGGFGPGTGSGGSWGSSSSSGRRVPQVRQAKAEVKGALDKDIVRRIVRAHINEVRYCYNAGLTKDPSLEGRVEVNFTIGPSGTVPVATVASSTLADASVGNCIAKAVKRWKFPKPLGGGNVIVTYPFVLVPG